MPSKTDFLRTSDFQRTSEFLRTNLDPTPLFAVVGATEAAVARVRSAAAGASAVQAQLGARVSALQADVEKRVSEFDPKAIRQQAQEAQNKAASRAILAASEAAGLAEARYGELAARGKVLVDAVLDTLSVGRRETTVPAPVAGPVVAPVKSPVVTPVKPPVVAAVPVVPPVVAPARKASTGTRKRAAASSPKAAKKIAD